MNKIKLLTIACALLVCSNLTMLGFLFFTTERRADPKHLIIKRLNFDKAQIVQYSTLVDLHRSSIAKTKAEIMQNKEQLYSMLNAADKPQIDTLIAQINSLQMQMEYINFEHFWAIKGICKPEQMGDYQRLTKDLAKMFANHKRK